MDTVDTKSIDKEKLVTMMVGRELTQMFPPRNSKIGEEVLRVENLNAGRQVRNISFHVRAGEILALQRVGGIGKNGDDEGYFWR